MSNRGPLTPKEFADVVFGGERSARWVCNQCRLYIKTRGKRGIAVIPGSRRYFLIPRSEIARLSSPAFQQVA